MFSNLAIQASRCLILKLLAVGLGFGQTDQFEWAVTHTIALSAKPTKLTLGADGELAAVGTPNGFVEILRLGRDTSSRPVMQQSAPVQFLSFSNDSSLLVSVGQDGSVAAYGIAAGTNKTFRIKSKVLAAALSRDSSLLAVASEDRTVTIWDLQSERQIATLAHKSKKPFFVLNFSDTDGVLTGVSLSGSICSWDVKRPTLLRCLQEQDQTVYAAAFALGGTLLALGTELSDFQKGPLGHISSASTGRAEQGPSGRSLGSQPIAGTARPDSVYRETRIRLYDLERGAVAKTLEGVTGAISAIALSPDGRYVSAARELTNSNLLSVYDTQRGVEVASSRLAAKGVAAAFSSRGEQLGVVADRDVIIRTIKGGNAPVTSDDLRGRKITITSSNSKPLVQPVGMVRIAVLDFEVNGADPREGRAVSDMVRTRLSEGENVLVVERTRMEQILQEQTIQLSDRFDQATAVKFGRMLGAAKMLLGSVTRNGSHYVINVRLIDVERGVGEGEREVTCDPCQSQHLQAAVIALKRVLVN